MITMVTAIGMKRGLQDGLHSFNAETRDAEIGAATRAQPSMSGQLSFQ